MIWNKTRVVLLLTTLLLMLSVTSIAAQTPVASGELVHTIGLDPNTCGTTSYLEVAPGTTVYHCYTFTNTGTVPLSNHTLVDNEFGVLLAGDPTVLQPGESLQVFASEVVEESHTHESVWTASAPYLPPVVAEDGVTIVVEPTAIQIGDGPSATGSTGATPLLALGALLLVAAGATVWRRRQEA